MESGDSRLSFPQNSPIHMQRSAQFAALRIHARATCACVPNRGAHGYSEVPRASRRCRRGCAPMTVTVAPPDLGRTRDTAVRHRRGPGASNKKVRIAMHCVGTRGKRCWAAPRRRVAFNSTHAFRAVRALSTVPAVGILEARRPRSIGCAS